MNKSTDKKLTLALTAVVSLLFSGVAIACMVYVPIVLTSAVLVRPAFSQSSAPAVWLEAGIAKEDVDGELKSAIEIYRKVADDQSASRDIRSKALLRLAGRYEKLGGKAKQVYEQVVREYADQPAASQARTRLAALRQQEHPAAPTTMPVRKIEWSAVGQMSDPDTDGQRAVFADSTAFINARGLITGNYLDAMNVYHGFVRDPGGAIATFDASGAGTGAYQGTLPQGINAAGAVTGYDIDANGASHGFLRVP